MIWQLTCGRDEVGMQLERHDRFGQVPEEGLDRAGDRLRLELERVVEAGIRRQSLT